MDYFFQTASHNAHQRLYIMKLFHSHEILRWINNSKLEHKTSFYVQLFIDNYKTIKYIEASLTCSNCSEPLHILFFNISFQI